MAFCKLQGFSLSLTRLEPYLVEHSPVIGVAMFLRHLTNRDSTIQLNTGCNVKVGVPVWTSGGHPGLQIRPNAYRDKISFFVIWIHRTANIVRFWSPTTKINIHSQDDCERFRDTNFGLLNKTLQPTRPNSHARKRLPNLNLPNLNLPNLNLRPPISSNTDSHLSSVLMSPILLRYTNMCVCGLSFYGISYQLL